MTWLREEPKGSGAVDERGWVEMEYCHECGESFRLDEMETLDDSECYCGKCAPKVKLDLAKEYNDDFFM